MEPLPSRLRDVEFHQQIRGYSPAEVDAFLAEIVQSVDELVAQVHHLENTARAQADRTIAPGDGPPSVTVEEATVARTLLLAQRTADQVIANAEEEARRRLDDARAEADRVVAEADARAAAVIEEARGTAESIMMELNRRRLPLERAIVSMRSRAIVYRDGLRDVLEDHAQSLDDWLAHHPALSTWDGEDTLSAPDSPASPSLVPLEEPTVDVTALENTSGSAVAIPFRRAD
jgi:DivIVA domain-containing protein